MMKKLANINITERGLWESISKIDKSWARLIKKKKKGQILKSIKFDISKTI